jgi:glutaredoxin-related protein
MSWLDRARTAGSAALGRVPGRVGDLARKANEALGRPLAGAEELADRRAFADRTAGEGQPKPAAKPASAAREPAPVIVYYMDKQKRDVGKLTDVLDANGITYKVTNIQEDPAAQYAVRRDSNGARLPVVFVAGECIGGRTELVNAAANGELKKKVFG